MKKGSLLLLLTGGLAASSAFATDGYFSHGFGMKAKSMGGVGIALPQDAIAAATNPAGMVMVGDRMDFGVDWFKPERGSSIVGNGSGANGTYDGNGTSDFFIPEFGYNKMMNANSSLGVSIYGNGGMNTDYAVNPFAAFGSTGPAGVNLEQLFIAPTWSTKVNDTNSIGISLNLAYQIFEAKGLQAFAGPGTSQVAGSNSLATNLGQDSSTGYGLHIGWIGQVTPTVSLGATYQTKTKMSNFTKYNGLFAQGGNFDIPETYGVGISVKATPQLTLAADVQQINYSKVPSIGNPFSNFNTCANGGGSYCLGGANGPGFGWKDVTVFKLGASYDYSKTMTLRGGLNINNQPIPSSETMFNILAPGVVNTHLTLGSTWKLENQKELTVAYMHAFTNTVSGFNSIPGGGFGNGNANLNMYENSLGVSYGW